MPQPVHFSPRLLGLILAIVTGQTAWANPPDADRESSKGVQIRNWENSRLGFFSSIHGECFARVQIGSMEPASHRMGPFQIASPGLRVNEVSVELFAKSCTPEDWTAFLAYWTPLSGLQLRDGIRVRMPDGDLLSGDTLPQIRGDKMVLRGMRRQADSPEGRTTVSRSYALAWTPVGPAVAPLAARQGPAFRLRSLNPFPVEAP